jgi:sigma-54 dependent transcriptional regulator, acetoin dehydrogenase operon transcriptional activator AcoR
MVNAALDKISTNPKNLERILDNIKDGIIAHDLDRRIFYFNTEAERITGYKRLDVLGQDCHDVFGAPFCGSNCTFCDTAPVENNPKQYAMSIGTKDGETRQVEMSVTGMLDEQGAFFGVLAAFKDITELNDLKIKSGQIHQFANIIGNDPKMRQVFQQIRDVAAYDYPVHVSGATGTGKELVAAAIHSESSRSKAPFVPINCGALPEGLIESELFGHVKGAFSGAIRDKKGRFELADGGTLFLDEVAELSKSLQVRLLRFLQEGCFEKVGGEKSVSVDVRVISATNKDLKLEVAQSRFRKDLYYRLNVIPIQLPPLEARRNDIPLLTAHFLEQAQARYGHKPRKLAPEALSMLMDYNWPGNVRELQNAVQFAIVKSRDDTISARDLPLEIREAQDALCIRGPAPKLSVSATRAALIKTANNKSKAAKLLGVGRATLYRFLGDHPETLTGL